MARIISISGCTFGILPFAPFGSRVAHGSPVASVDLRLRVREIRPVDHLGGHRWLPYSRPVGFRRGIVAVAVVTAATMVCGCTKASHPTQLSTASGSQPIAATDPASSAPIASTPAPSVAPSVAVSSSAASSPTTAGTSSSSATSLPTPLSSSDIAAGVRATAQEFFDDLNIAFATGDVTKIEALTSPACGCRSVVNTIKNTYAQHQRIVGVVSTVTKLEVVSFFSTGATANVHYTISAGRVLDANGTQVNSSVADLDQNSAMFVIKVGGKWIVQQNTSLNRAKT